MGKKKIKVRPGAPYVEPEKKYLGDAYLDGLETRAREEEKTLKMAAKARIHGQEELEDADRSAGPRLHYSEVIRRLQKICPRLKVMDSQGGSDVAMYRPKFHWEYDDEQRDPEQQEWRWHYVYAGGMPKGWLPEWAHVTLDSSKLAKREIRGWRSVLLSFIKCGAITEAAAIKEFGDPSGDQRSGRWREQLWEFRNKEKVYE